MSDAEKWAANKTFLDRAINKGAKLILATPMTDIKRGVGLREKSIIYWKWDINLVMMEQH